VSVADLYLVDARSLPLRAPARFAGLTLSNVWATAVVALSVGVTFMFRMSSIDLVYHLRAGEAILSTHGAPSVDAFTFSMAGRPWLDQQWGAQILLALVYRAGGWVGMALFHAALVGATFWFLWLACRARGASARLSAALTMSGFVVCFYNAGMRPQTMAYPLFTGALWILADRRAHPRRLWVLPAVMVVWANVHGSFPLGLVLIALSWAEDRRDHAATKNTTLAVGVIGLFATLVGPYGLGVWRYAIGISTNERILGHVEEWAATTIRSADGALFFLSALAVVVLLARRGVKTDALTLVWLGSFFLLGLSAARGEVWWGFVFPVTMAGLIVEEPRSPEDERGSLMMNLLVVTTLIAFVAVLSPWVRDRIDPSSGETALLSYAPQRMVDAVQRVAPADARLFVTLPYASWFEYASPTNPMFVDPRIELFPDDVWDDYFAVAEGHEGWQGIVDRWGVDVIVMAPGDATIVALLQNDPGWRLAYRDTSGSVFVRA
jgi:hypothetical protein